MDQSSKVVPEINNSAQGLSTFIPLNLSNRAFSFNFISYQNTPGEPLKLSVTANENKPNGQFASISLMPDEVHKLTAVLMSAIKGSFSSQASIATRKTASLVVSKEEKGLTIYLNKTGISTPYLRIDRFAANLIRMKANEHLCKLFDLPEDVVCEMIATVDI